MGHRRLVAFLQALLEAGGDYLEPGAIKRLGCGCQLGDDLLAGTTLLDHGDDAIYLAPHPAQPGNDIAGDFRIHVHEAMVVPIPPPVFAQSWRARLGPRVTDMTAGRIALVGSGEYLPVMQEIEAWLLEGRPSRYVQLATAAAPEGPASLQRWHDLGSTAAARLGVEQVVIDVRTREDADRQSWADEVAGAGLVYLSGGNPGYLARTLSGTRVWRAIRSAWLAGASLAGCSAGAMALAGYVPDFRHPRRGGVEGLGIVPDARVLPHFDRYAKWMPDIALRPLVSDDACVIGIDEDTALLAEPADEPIWEFRARGRQSAWRIEPDRRHRINGVLPLRVDIDGA